jgi:hypothetical protein
LCQTFVDTIRSHCGINDAELIEYAISPAELANCKARLDSTKIWSFKEIVSLSDLHSGARRLAIDPEHLLCGRTVELPEAVARLKRETTRLELAVSDAKLNAAASQAKLERSASDARRLRREVASTTDARLQEVERREKADAKRLKISRKLVAAERARAALEAELDEALKKDAAAEHLRPLTRAQQAAIAKVRSAAEVDSATARPALVAKFKEYRSSMTEIEVEGVLTFIKVHSELHINVNFPKRVGPAPGRMLVDMFCDGETAEARYKTLLEVGHGGGSTDVGSRTGWERRLFGPAFDAGGVTPRERPKYGNLGLLAHTAGDKQARQYGGSYFVLNRASVQDRVTLSSCDSSCSSAKNGTLDHCDHVLLDLINRQRSGTKRRELMNVLDHLANRPETVPFPKVDLELMPNYIEIQVHGDVFFAEDIDEVVVHAGEAAKEGVREALATFRRKFGRGEGGGGQIRKVVRWDDGVLIRF